MIKNTWHQEKSIMLSIKFKIHNCKWLCSMWIVTFVYFVIRQNNTIVDCTITGYITNCLDYEGDYMTGLWVFQKTWWLISFMYTLLNPASFYPLAHKKEISSTGCPIEQYLFLDYFLRYLLHLVGLGNTSWVCLTLPGSQLMDL